MGFFLLREAKPEFFGDYYAELRDRGEPSGELLLIQLKGQVVLKKSNGFGKVQLDVKALRYYAKNAEQPVFIVLVDNENRRAYYLFAQGWLDENPDVLDKADDSRATVPVPLVNDLSVTPKFISDFRAATRIMRDKRPGTPEAALAHIVAPLNALDSRFSVQASVGPSGRVFSISAKEPTDISFTLKGDRNGLKKFVEGLGYGKSVSISGVGVSAHGSALFEEICAESKTASLAITVAEKRNCLVTLSCDYPDMRFNMSMPSGLTAGPLGICVTSEAGNCPLSFEHTFASKGGRFDGGGIRITANGLAWENIPILDAPWFDGIINFTKALLAKKTVKLRLEIDGKSALDARIEFSSPDERASPIWRWFQLLGWAADVSKYFGINPRIPRSADVTVEAAEKIGLAHEILTQSVITRPYVIYAQKQPTEQWLAFVEAVRNNGWVYPNFSQYHPFVASVFGETKELGLIYMEPRDIKIVPVGEVETPITAESLAGKSFQFHPLKGKSLRLRLLKKKIEDIIPAPAHI